MTHDKLGVAIDIGTTTVVLHLLDLLSGKRLSTKSSINNQVKFGADVTSRIRHSAVYGYETLMLCIREQISAMILDACSSSGKKSENIEYICIAANTVMQHLSAGYSPEKMGSAPFPVVSLFGEELPAWKDLPVSKNTMIYYTPAISAYVGGDITAGLLAAGFDDITGPAIFLDIGTNGEIVLKQDNTYYCCATAAGPAFEGAEIAMGMVAEKGAIDHVKWNDRIEFSVLGGGNPTGLCGSGLLDTLAVMLDIGAVDTTGRLLDNDKYWLTGCEASFGIFITAGDIRKLQLAKAAIAAGIQVLLHFAGIAESEVSLLALAGGFGSYMDLKSAARTGLFPASMLPVAKAVGNTAGEGAIMALSSENSRLQLENIWANCEYIELSSMTFFNDKFVDQMAFEKDIGEE